MASNFYDSWRGGGTGTGAYTLQSRATTDVALTAQGVAGQTADVFRVLNSAGTELFTVDNSGNIDIAGTITAIINEVVTGNISATGNLSITGTSSLTGAASLGGALSVTGAVTLAQTLTVAGATVFNGSVTFNGSNTYTGVTLFSDGTAAVPSISFSQDTDTGIYRAAANQIGFTTSGAVQMTISASDVDLQNNTLSLANGIAWSAGVAVTAASYQIIRDADGTNQLHANVPTGATFEWSVNDVAKLVLNTSALLPGTSDGLDIGSTTVPFSDIYLSSSSSINFNNSDVTITYTSGQLAFAGGIYVFSESFAGGASERILIDPTLTISSGTQSNSTRSNNAKITFTGSSISTGTFLTGSSQTGIQASGDWSSTGTCTELNGGTFAGQTGSGITNGTMSALYGIQSATLHQGDGTVTLGVAVNALVYLTGNGNMTTGIGYDVSVSDTGAGAFTNVTGLRIGAFSAGSTLNLGIDIGVISGTGAASIRQASGAVMNWGAGDVLLTHSANAMAWTGASSGYSFDATITDTAGINFGGTTLANYVEGTFTPTVTLVGGAGNTVPVYSTNTGRYTRIGNRVFVDVYLTGDGGNEGAGSGTFTVAIPIASNASHPTSYFPCGFFANNTAEEPIWGQIAGGASVIDFAYEDVLNNFTVMTGAEQNNATRTVRLKFSYEV